MTGRDGHVPAPLVPPLEALAAAMPVVLCSRVAEGPVFTETYGFPGSERDLLARGLLHGEDLGPVKARLLLQLSLLAGHDRASFSRLLEDAASVL